MEHTANDRELSVLLQTAQGCCEIVKDCIVPDAYSDVKKLLASSVKLSPRKESCEEDGVIYGGSLSVTVVFLTEDGEVASLTIESDYEGKALCRLDGGSVQIASFPTYEGFQSRLVNPRKIGIRLKVKPNLYLWEDIDTSLTFPDQVTNDDRLTFEERYARVGYTRVSSYRADGVESGDDIHIEAPHPEMSELLMKEVRFSSVSAEARKDAVAVNGNAEILLWYLGRDREGKRVLSTYRHALPISTLVECEGVSEGETVLASLFWEDASFALSEDGQGEKRICECDFTYGVLLTAMRECYGYVTKDSYSTRYESELVCRDLRVYSDSEKTTATFRARTAIPLKSGYQPIAIESTMKEAHIEEGEDGRALICGSASLYTVLENRESGQYTAETSEITFSHPLPLSYDGKREYALSLSKGAPEYKAEGETLTLSLGLSGTVLSFMPNSERYVFEARPVAESESACASGFTVYYPAKEESPWEIAKKYRVREDSLVFAESEKAKGEGKRRVVMILPKRKPLYRTTIAGD